MKKMLILSCLSLAVMSVMSCNKEPDVAPVPGKQITLSVGFEDQTSADAPQSAATKTYLQNEKTVQWGSTSQDKVIYVFDSNGAKNVFDAVGPLDDSEEPKLKNGPQREFQGSISEGSEINYVIWTGFAANQDQCTLSNGVFSGTTLKVENPQTVSNANSFDNTSNIAVMKPGDTALRNVFGYIKYTVPALADGSGAIKSVTFSAAESLAGNVQIDYAGNDPVATLVGSGSSLTVNTRVRNSIIEAGTYYAVLPAGTYTNFNIKVTLADDTSFDLPVSDPVTIVRGKYTTAGTLPVEDPNASEEPEPEDPGESVVWPNDATAFDYGLSAGQSRRQEYDQTALPNQVKITSPITSNDITYGIDGMFYGNRMTLDQVKQNWVAGYSGVIPDRQYQSFKINRPGTLTFYQACASKDGDVLRVPTYHLAVITTVDGVTSAKIVDSVTPTNVTTARPSNTNDSYSDANMQYHVTLTVSEEDLQGITEAATVYLYHTYAGNTCNVHYYALTWTSAN